MRKNFFITKLIVVFFLLNTQYSTLNTIPCYASKSEIKTLGIVPSFGTYSFRGSLNFTVKKPGRFEIGKITVFGTYNGAYPWIMRIYTDNTNLTPLAGSLSAINKAGLISEDGQYTVPLEAACPNFGKDVWVYVPDINNDTYKAYAPPREVGTADYTECIIMGLDPRNADWVSGPDRTLFTADDNPLGDTTLATPFDIRFAAYFDEKTIKGKYTSNLYIELVPAP
ncbi:MAG: hypothetical protein PHO42_00990 [Candidatus Omnitrophica bacterium]|nr:hypothetical protein [Candidatus Omnitrophota bacterium]